MWFVPTYDSGHGFEAMAEKRGDSTHMLEPLTLTIGQPMF
jgi:hypothetical protein